MSSLHEPGACEQCDGIRRTRLVAGLPSEPPSPDYPNGRRLVRLASVVAGPLDGRSFGRRLEPIAEPEPCTCRAGDGSGDCPRLEDCLAAWTEAQRRPVAPGGHEQWNAETGEWEPYDLEPPVPPPDRWTDDRLDVAHVIRLAAGPLIFLGGVVIGWRIRRGVVRDG